MPRKMAVAAVVVLEAALSGCARHAWVEEEVLPPFDHGVLRSVAVAEFANRSRDAGAGRLVADRLEEMLVDEAPYRVVTRRTYAKASPTLWGEGGVDFDTVRRFGAEAAVDAVVVGVVEELSSGERKLKADLAEWLVQGDRGRKVERAASVRLSMKLVVTATGQVLWARSAAGEWAWSGWTGEMGAVDEDGCADRAVSKALDEARALYPHRRRVRTRL